MSTAFDLEDEFGLWPEAASQPEAGEGGTASGQKRPRFDEGQMVAGKKRCAENFQEEVDDEQRSGGGKTANTTASADSKGDDLPVVWRGKVPACAYCNKEADSKSP